MIATDGTVGQAEGIIDDTFTCFRFYLLNYISRSAVMHFRLLFCETNIQCIQKLQALDWLLIHLARSLSHCQKWSLFSYIFLCSSFF